MGYSLDFGWLGDALGAIARGAAMTILLIAVTDAARHTSSASSARRTHAAGIRRSGGDRDGLCRADPQHAVPGAAVLHLLRAAEPRHPARSGRRGHPRHDAQLAAYGTEIVGAGLDAVPPGQTRGGPGAGAAGPARSSSRSCCRRR